MHKPLLVALLPLLAITQPASAQMENFSTGPVFEDFGPTAPVQQSAGVPQENIQIAIVVHGGASLDLTNQAFFAAHKDGAKNASASAVAQLQDHGVTFYLCGQSAAAHGISNADLLPGVQMSLSAMTAHALLQQQDFTINPF